MLRELRKWDCQKSGHLWQLGEPFCLGCGVPWEECYDGEMRFADAVTFEFGDLLDASPSQEPSDN